MENTMITARTTQELSEQEIKIFGQFCLDHGIKTDSANIEVLAAYLERWNVVVNDESLEKATVILRDAGQLQFYSEAETTYRKIAAEDQTRAARLADWFENFNKTLIKAHDEGWENQAALLTELRGREINSPNVHAAIGRISSTRGGLHYTPIERKTDSRQHQDSGAFAPKTNDRSIVGGRRNHAFTEPSKEVQKADIPADAWQQMCQKMLGTGPHSRQAEFLAIYMKPGSSYREKYSELVKLKNSYERVGRI
jgi:hypothetical protein